MCSDVLFQVYHEIVDLEQFFCNFDERCFNVINYLDYGKLQLHRIPLAFADRAG